MLEELSGRTEEDKHDWRAETRESRGRGFVTQNKVFNLAMGSHWMLSRGEHSQWGSTAPLPALSSRAALCVGEFPGSLVHPLNGFSSLGTSLVAQCVFSWCMSQQSIGRFMPWPSILSKGERAEFFILQREDTEESLYDPLKSPKGTELQLLLWVTYLLDFSILYCFTCISRVTS